MPTYIFSGADPQTGYEPWIFDTTANTSWLVSDIASGPAWGLDPQPAEFTRFSTGALFAGTDDDGGSELWFTDGTADGTLRLADIAQGPRDSWPSSITVSGDLAYFSATTYETGSELWVTDGTEAGTRRVMDLVSGQFGTDPFNLQAFGSGVIFNSYELGGLWYAEGDRVTNLSDGVDAVLYGKTAVTEQLIVYSTPLRHPSEIWVSNGTQQGTQILFGEGNTFGIARISDVQANSSLFYFTAEAISGRTQLYVTDGTLSGTRLLVDDGVLLDVNPALEATDNFVFFLDDAGSLWSISQGTLVPQKLMSVDLFFGVIPSNSEDFALFRTAQSGAYESSIWITDGTPSGTVLLLQKDYANILTIEGDRVLVGFYEGSQSYIAEFDVNGNELSRTAIDYDPSSTEIGGEILGSPSADILEGGAGADTLNGGEGDDVLAGEGGDDVLVGGTGDDRSSGGSGNDTLRGDAGSDTLYGDAGADRLEGGDENDSLLGGGGNDSLLGGSGNDTLAGDDGDDVLYGDDGDDLMVGIKGNDTLYGEEGNDTLSGGTGADLIFGGNGHDDIWGGFGNDTLWGGSGDDRMGGSEDNDLMYGGHGNDTVWGGSQHDTLYGEDGSDNVGGFWGNDLAYGGAGDDFVWGNFGNDTLYGDDGNDMIGSAEGNDELFGGNGNDTLVAGDSEDTLWGGSGDDMLTGGAGDDWLSGGADADTFFFYHYHPGQDTIADFDPAVDLIQISSNAYTFQTLPMWQNGDDAILYLDRGTITLVDTDLTDLGADNFLFG